jgi:abhydrolase domain-containing protein 8
LHETPHFLSLPAYVQHHLAVGQSWPEGDVAFHRKITVPTLLVHGLKDKYVSLVEMCEMERVSGTHPVKYRFRY